MMTYSEYKASYSEDLSNYKTTASKKAYLTRCKKQVEELLNDIRTNVSGWLYGEPVTAARLYDVKRELEAINNLYNEC